MSKGQKNQNKKKKVRSLILLLFLTIIMLSTSTYAWFTANKTVTISTIDVNVASSSGIQISADALTWGGTVTNADITGFTQTTNQFPTTGLQPVSTDGTLNDGKMNMYFGTIEAKSTGTGYDLTAVQETDTQGTGGHYVAFDVYLKLDTKEDVYLTTTSKIQATSAETDSGIQNAARVAFIVYDTVAVGAEATAIASTAVSATYASPIIWEPNANIHTTSGEANRTTNVLLYTVTNDTENNSMPNYVKTYGVNTAIPTAVTLSNALAGNGVTQVTEMNPAIKSQGPGLANYHLIFGQLPAGITKVRIYYWVEGQDVDCENGASGGNVKLDLQFSTNDGTGA